MSTATTRHLLCLNPALASSTGHHSHCRHNQEYTTIEHKTFARLAFEEMISVDMENVNQPNETARDLMKTICGGGLQRQNDVGFALHRLHQIS